MANDFLGLDMGVVAGLTLAGLSLDLNTKQLNTFEANKQQNDDFQDELMEHLRHLDTHYHRIVELLEKIEGKL